jgi:hypothetical protein
MRSGHIDLVQHRDDLQAAFLRDMEDGDGLGLYTLGGVDEQEGTLAGSEGARDFPAEVDVALWWEWVSRR